MGYRTSKWSGQPFATDELVAVPGYESEAVENVLVVEHQVGLANHRVLDANTVVLDRDLEPEQILSVSAMPDAEFLGHQHLRGILGVPVGRYRFGNDAVSWWRLHIWPSGLDDAHIRIVQDELVPDSPDTDGSCHLRVHSHAAVMSG